MKDLDLIKQLGEDLAPREDEPLAALPAAVFRDSPRRRALKTWHVGVVALAVVGATAAVAGSWPSSHTPPGQAATPRAATVLDNAAVVGRQSTITRLEEGGYIFTETVSSYPEQVQQPDGSFKIMRTAPVVTQIWLPVDPTKSGKQRQRPKDGNAEWWPWIAIASCQEERNPTKLGDGLPQCTRGVLPANFPADPSAVLAWLKGDRPAGTPSPRPSSAGPIGGEDGLALEAARTLLVTGTYLLPAQRSAIFKALAKLPGVTAVANVQDGAGRQGIGISAGGHEALVFDSTSFAFLGTTSSAVMRQGATTEAGKIPS
ncbi:CU044_5270 family protein [Micromonospora sp. NBC_01655]|uniref:CU044_5270 family protein n=1 Tax=Micromonospora sp. NBC_01655 TaxID=2975983 RepID=UPI00225BEA18|nr:CU044_5270 family protein [Micromonospora sp. NBC_01655]MCX4473632.1 CU044_5270 family protein [Micromonospora sp. NBC_01655]